MIALLLALGAPSAHACRPPLLAVDWILPENGAANVPSDARAVIRLVGGGASTDFKVALTDSRGTDVRFTRTDWQDGSDTALPGAQYIGIAPGGMGGTYVLTVYAPDGSTSSSKFGVVRSLAGPPVQPGTSFYADSGVVVRGDSCATGDFRELGLCAAAPADSGLELVYTYRVTDVSTPLEDLVATTRAATAGDTTFLPEVYTAWGASVPSCFRTVHEAANGKQSTPSDVVCVGVDPVIGTCPVTDGDGDGYTADDCDDTDANVNPGASEVPYDGVDNDCDAATPDDDLDGDGFLADLDCDDDDPEVNPDATDAWYDGVDANCDGADDFDQDADGWRSDAHGGSDCDDTDDTVNPDASDDWYDGVDSDCDGANDFDQDADGYENDQYGGDDCDDEDPALNPAADDVPGDGVDQDCSGADATEDPNPEPESEPAGCGCTAGPTGPLWLLGLVLPAVFRRRRSPPAPNAC